ncbi:peptidase C65 otubain protein [Ceratobasidium sp. AG-Ba]|nr:peptidase C65 otubain protein [Ceratobasidium sp. AG-Ba]
MSLTTVSSASFHIPVPRVFGLGLGRDPSPPPPAPRRRNGSSSPRKRPSSPARAGPSSSAQPRTPNPPRPSTQPRASGSQQPRATFARVRHRRRAPTVSSISTLSSLISSTIPPPTELPPPPSLTAALRTLEKLKIPNTIRVEGWRAGVADATGSEPMGAAGNEPVARTEPAPNVAPPAAVAAASAERSNLRSLSDEDIFALTQNIKNEEASRRPLVSPISPLSELRAEFSPLSEAKHGGWSGIRRTRGDGDCFYRSLAFAYVEKIMTAPEPGLAVATSLSHLESTLPLLEQAGFQKIVFEDFYESFAELIQHIFQNPEVSNSIVVFLRLLTSSYIRLSPEDDFTPFSTGREADHPQIMALSKALRVRIEVAYLDNSSGTVLDDGTVRVDFVKFAPEGAEKDGTKPVVLLYRPGHYDTLEEKVEG